MNFIPCATWIRRGVSKEIPDQIQLEKEDLQRILKGAADDIDCGMSGCGSGLTSGGMLSTSGGSGTVENNLKSKSERRLTKALDDTDVQGEEDEDENDEMTKVSPEENKDDDSDEDDDDVMAKYDLDNYDDAEEDAIKAESLTGIKSIACFASNDEDPYITIKNDDSDDDEEDNKKVKATDNLIAVGHVDQDMSILEFHVYNEDEEHLYVHHDIILPAFPLCLEWLDFDADDGGKGNFIAVGSMLPQIDIWDVDIINSLEPSFSLGSKKKKKKKDSKKKTKLDGHSDAVLSLSWNKLVRHGLASGSADRRILLWDLQTKSCVTKIKDHNEKVQALQWHPFEAQTLLSGSCDRTVKLFDCRNASAGAKTWEFESEIEKVLWNHFDPYHFYVSTESGNVGYMDVRMEVPVYNFKAHSDSVTSLSLSSHCPGCLVTVSTDKSFKIWDTLNNQPECIMEHDFRLGQVYCVASCPDNAFVVCAGGDNRENNFVVWDIRQFDPVVARFGNRQLLKVDASSSKDDDSMETDDAVQGVSSKSTS